MAKDPICNEVSTRLVIQILTDSRPFPTFEFNFDPEKPHATAHVSACQTSPLWDKAFVMFFCYCLVLFVVNSFFFTFISCSCGAKIGGFGVALKNPSRWKSVTWYKLRFQREVVCFCRFVPPLHSQNLCRNQAKDGRDLYNLIST